MAVVSYREFKGIQEKKPESPLPEKEVPVQTTEESPVQRRKPKADDPWFYLEHPDFSPSNRVTCEFDLEIDGITEKVILENGRIETQVKEVKDVLVKRGYRFMNEEF